MGLWFQAYLGTQVLKYPKIRALIILPWAELIRHVIAIALCQVSWRFLYCVVLNTISGGEIWLGLWNSPIIITITSTNNEGLIFDQVCWFFCLSVGNISWKCPWRFLNRWPLDSQPKGSNGSFFRSPVVAEERISALSFLQCFDSAGCDVCPSKTNATYPRRKKRNQLLKICLDSGR